MRSPRIVGIYPPPREDYFSPPSALPHQGLLYLLSHVKSELSNSTIIFLDSQIRNPLNEPDLIFGDILCVSPTFLSLVSAFRLAEIAKNNGMYVVFGGEQARMMGNELLKNVAAIDAIAYEMDGEGIIEYCKSGEPNRIKTWITRDTFSERSIVHRWPNIGLKLIKQIDYSLCELNDYQNPPYTFQIIGQRGCCWKIRNAKKHLNVCSFCSRSDLDYESISPYDYHLSMRRLWDQYGQCQFSDRSESFIQNSQWLNALYKITSNLTDSFDGRINDCLGRLDQMTEPNLRKLHCLGVRTVGVGVESLDDGVLKNIGKGISSIEMMRKVELVCRKGFRIWMNFILGLPGENHQSHKSIVSFLKNLARKKYDFSCTINLIQPTIGTEIYNKVANMNSTSFNDRIDIDQLQYLYFHKYFGDSYYKYQKRRRELSQIALELLQHPTPFPGEGWKKEEILL